MSEPSFRRDWITKPIFRWARHVLPSLSATEREAIEAGDVWWDADLFTGNPDWAKLLAFPPAAPGAARKLTGLCALSIKRPVVLSHVARP